MRRLRVIAIVVFGLAAACSAKNETGAPPAPAKSDPGPISPNSWLLNPPNQPAR
jgi:hypothetical protein